MQSATKPTEWGFQLRVDVPCDSGWKHEWRWVNPSQGEPYRFASEDQARRMMEMCYPQLGSDQVRVARHD